VSQLSGAGQSREIIRKDEIETKSGSQWVENIRSVLRDKEEAARKLATTGSTQTLNWSINHK
jgi:hypothetical protein